MKSIVYLQSISCHYASAEIEFIDVKGSIQEQMEKETFDMARKKIIAKGVNPESLTLKVRRTCKLQGNAIVFKQGSTKKKEVSLSPCLLSPCPPVSA